MANVREGARALKCTVPYLQDVVSLTATPVAGLPIEPRKLRSRQTLPQSGDLNDGDALISHVVLSLIPEYFQYDFTSHF